MFKNWLYEWVRMPMGFKNAPAIFQRIMDTILKDMQGNGVEVYLNGIIIYDRTESEHGKKL